MKSVHALPAGVTRDGVTVTSAQMRALASKLTYAQLANATVSSESETAVFGTLPAAMQICGVRVLLPKIEPSALAAIVHAGLNALAKQHVAKAEARLRSQFDGKGDFGFDDLFPLGSRAYSKLITAAIEKVASGSETPYIGPKIQLTDLVSADDGQASDLPSSGAASSGS